MNETRKIELKILIKILEQFQERVNDWGCEDFDWDKYTENKEIRKELSGKVRNGIMYSDVIKTLTKRYKKELKEIKV